MTRQEALCTGALLRRVMRRMTNHYDEALKPTGLKLTQYSLLANISINHDCTISALAEIMEMDRTTLSRNLRPLQERQLVMVSEGKNKRERVVNLTTIGQKVFRDAVPHWRHAEQSFRSDMGKEKASELHSLLHISLNSVKKLNNQSS